MNRISEAVIRAGHTLLDLDIDSMIRGRCDSFVLKTDVHFPTDINLLYDAIPVLSRDCVKLNEDYILPGWCQHQYNLRQFKAHYRKVQKLRHSTSKDETKQQAQAEKICKTHRDYIVLAQTYVARTAESLELLENTYKIPSALLLELKIFKQHAERQIDQIQRRVLEDKKGSFEKRVGKL